MIAVVYWNVGAGAHPGKSRRGPRVNFGFRRDDKMPTAKRGAILPFLSDCEFGCVTLDPQGRRC